MHVSPRTYAAICVLLLLLGSVASGSAAEPDPRENWIFVSDDDARGHFPQNPGCDAISVIDARTGRALTRGDFSPSVGQLTASSDGAVVVSISINQGPPVYILRRSDVMWGKGVTDMLYAPDVVAGSRPAITLDDRGLLLSRGNGIERYELANITGSGLGQRSARYVGATAADVVFAQDPNTALVLDPDGLVHFLDVVTLQSVREPIPFTPLRTGQRRLRNTHGAVSPDGRYLVVNTGEQADITIIDLASGATVVVGVPGLLNTWGLAFNYAATNNGLLAIHGGSKVGVFRFNAMAAPSIVADINVPAMSASAWRDTPADARLSTLAWTGSGDGVVVAVRGSQEYRVLDLVTGGTQPVLVRRLDFDACTASPGWSLPVDVLTLNDRMVVRPTPTPSACATPPPTDTPTPTDTPSPTDTPTVTPGRTASPSPTATPTASPTHTPTSTPVPQPVYLPVALKEKCIVGQQRVDVALVMDASTSMRDERTVAGRPKLDVAIEAAGAFLGMLALPSDQAALVSFNSTAATLQELTGNRALLNAAFGRITVARQTRIHLGVALARQELGSPRRRAGNQAVMIVLTDGKANPDSPELAVGEAKAAQADGIAVFAIGLGTDATLDVDALKRMASRPEYFFLAADGEDLHAIYQAIAVTIPCPAESFWGKR